MLVLGGINHSRGAAKRAYAQVKLRPLKKQSGGTDRVCPAALSFDGYSVITPHHIIRHIIC